MKTSTSIKLAVAIIVIVLLLAGFFWLRDLTKDDHFSLGSDPQIDVRTTISASEAILRSMSPPHRS